ncbi:nitroreductase family protein [Blastomonas aquatica]|uniref:Putative NAD(P)H nitroreductase n=1 Tax=Blastomonas aquatica TaxID=1510276 RepID=A0ABQ1J3P2_9SPHN|nr:nitroreductase [Blastomonas aquatica]GGB57993.1 nitroreductase [Blastomonas aquatica]
MNQFNDLSSVTAYLASRRSGRPRDMIAPGPDAAQLRAIVATASRTPDHGKLNPWRVVHIAGHQRDALADVLTTAYRAEKPEAGRLEIEAMETFARQAPELLVVLYSPREASKIPLWEQELSVGAFIMNLLHATHASGFVGGWITGWPSYSDAVRNHFGTAPETIAGFLFLGTASQPLEERPRPEMDAVFSDWRAHLF